MKTYLVPVLLSAVVAHATPEFVGVLSKKGDSALYAVSPSRDIPPQWVKIGSVVSGYLVTEYRAEEEVLVLKKDRQFLELRLKDAKVRNGASLLAASPADPDATREQIHLRMIQIKRENGETDEQLLERTRQTVISRLQAGHSFSEVAKECSQDPRRQRGGDWGWISRSELKSDYRETAFQLKKGECSAPIVLPEGCFILFVEERRVIANITEPNKAPEPTTTSVTSPAAQEPRQP